MARFYIDDENVLQVEDLTPGSLEDSIQKWKFICDNNFHGVIYQLDTCALCDAYIRLCCEGCPVSDRTGEISCDDTPVIGFQDAEDIGDTELMHLYAIQELGFLLSLRNDEVTP